MERRRRLSSAETLTTAERIANVQNKRETLLLARASKGMWCETDEKLRDFYRQKARANKFLKAVGMSSGLLNVHYDDHGKQILNTSKNEEVKDKLEFSQRVRKISLDVNSTAETQRRIQEFLGRNAQVRQVRNEEEDDTQPIKFGDRGLTPSAYPESSKDESGKVRPITLDPKIVPSAIKIRTRASGICFHHSQSLPCSSVSVERKFSEGSSLMKNYLSSRPNCSRKLSQPAPAIHRTMLDHGRLSSVIPNFPLTQGRKNSWSADVQRSSRPLTSTKKHSV